MTGEKRWAAGDWRYGGCLRNENAEDVGNYGMTIMAMNKDTRGSHSRLPIAIFFAPIAPELHQKPIMTVFALPAARYNTLAHASYLCHESHTSTTTLKPCQA